MSKFYSLIFMLILCLGVVSALGITPGRTTFDFSPGEKKDVQIKVLNTEGEDMDVVLMINGELNSSITLSQASFSLPVSSPEKTFTYTLIMPEKLSPGLHTAEIIALKLPSNSGNGGTFVGATVAVATQVFVQVPYPGKYADADFQIFDAEEANKVRFVIPVVSRGASDLVRVRGVIDVYSSLNEKVTTIGTSEITVPAGERKEVSAVWDTASAQPGPYRAVATLIYDEQTVKFEQAFTVGKPLLDLQEVSVNDFSLGDIAKFEMLVENTWNQPIYGAYAQMQIFNKDKQAIADFKSQTYDLLPLTKSIVVAFWDSEGVKEGTYDSSIFLRYGESSIRKDLQLKVSANDIEVIGVGYVIAAESTSSGGSLTIILIVIIVVLVLINLVWFLILRKRLKKGK